MLSPEKVEGIRAALAAGRNQSEIAREFGCHRNTVIKIKRGQIHPKHGGSPAVAARPLADPKPLAEPEPEPTPRTSTWTPQPPAELASHVRSFAGMLDEAYPPAVREPSPPATLAPRKGFQTYEEQAEDGPRPLSELVMKLKIHVEKAEFEPVRRLLRDPDLRVLAAAMVFADGKQWSAVERLVADYDGDADPGLSLDSWLAESGLPARIVNYMEEAGFTTFATLEGVPRSRLEQIPYMGPKAIDAVVDALRRAVENTKKLETVGKKDYERE